MDFIFDRSAFSAQTFEEEQKTKKFSKDTVNERLKVAFYLNSIAFRYNVSDPPQMDKTVFSMRKLK